MRRNALVVLLAAAAVCLSACSVSISSNDVPDEEAAASAEATIDASESAVIDQEIYDFCTNDAQGSIDFIAVMGEDADLAIADGIQQGIEQQQMNEAQAAACKLAWADVLEANGIEMPDLGDAPSASPSATP